MFYGDLNRQLGISEGMFLKRGEGDSAETVLGCYYLRSEHCKRRNGKYILDEVHRAVALLQIKR